MPRKETFIEYVCRKIRDYDLSRYNLYVVLPNLRLKRVLTERLLEQTDKDVPCFLPHFTTINRLIGEFSQLRQAENTELVARLYTAYRKVLAETETEDNEVRSLDRFWDWAQILISDFNRIDNQLAPADEILHYIAEDKRIGSWQLNLNEEAGMLQNRYLKFYRNLSPLYRKFTEDLLREGIAYTGLAGKTAAQKLPELLREGLPAKDNFYLFVGLNALTQAEKSIIKTLVREGKGETLWNADRYYMENPVQEAGYFLRQYRQDPDLNHNLHEEDFSDNLRTLPYRIYACPQNTGQVQVAARILRKEKEPGETVVVLNDESLFAPLMNALPENIPLNVSIAANLSGCAAGGLFNTLNRAREAVQRNANRQLPGDALMELLQNPLFVKTFTPAKSRKDLAGEIRARLLSAYKNRFTREEFLDVFPEKTPALGLCADLIYSDNADPNNGNADPNNGNANPNNGNTDPNNSNTDLFQQAAALCRFLLEAMKDSLFSETENLFDRQYLLQLEALCAQESLNLQAFPELEFGPLSQKRIFDNCLSQIGLNYIGNAETSLNVTGMLETRGMAFKHVIILSMNEGILPDNSRKETFLLQGLTEYYHIPSAREETAMAAHHFYSLLQNSRKASLIYAASPADRTQEMSRFLLQLQYELPQNREKTANDFPIALFNPHYEGSAVNAVLKTPALLNAIRTHLTRRPSSFSSLSEYLACPMRYYRDKILGVGEAPEISDELDASVKGKVFHLAMRRFFESPLPDGSNRIGKALTQDDVKALLQNKEELVNAAMEKEFPQGTYRHGANYLAYQEILIWIERYAEALAEEIENGTLKVLVCEKNFLHTLPRAFDNRSVEIKGIIDRIDSYQPKGEAPYLRIVDYKTGGVKNLELTGESLADDIELLKNKDGFQAFQLLLYLYLFSKENRLQSGKKENVRACICSLNKEKRGRMSQLQGPLPETASLSEIATQTEDFLRKIFADITEPDTPIRCTNDAENCTYCPYNEFCQAEEYEE